MANTIDPVIVPDELRTEVSDKFVFPCEYEGHFESIMLTRSEILKRVNELAEIIHRDYSKKRPVMVCVLKGANPFFQNLLEALQNLKQGYTTEFVRASSYGGLTSSGVVSVSGGLVYENLKNRHVILVEDIVDTGTTLSFLIPRIENEAEPKSLQLCTLLEKRLKQPPKCTAKYRGFSIPDNFIVGYGLDYNELYRDVQDIWVLSKKGIAFDQSEFARDM